jgi:hypothetical protein
MTAPSLRATCCAKNDENQGFNASTDVYENLVAAGVIDPTKVVRTALQDAASVAGLLITTEAAISEKPEDKPAMGRCPRAAWAAWAAWTSKVQRQLKAKHDQGPEGKPSGLFSLAHFRYPAGLTKREPNDALRVMGKMAPALPLPAEFRSTAILRASISAIGG